MADVASAERPGQGERSSVPTSAASRRSNTAVVSQLVAGSLGGLMADLVMHPVNTVQTNMQSGLAAPRRLSSLYRGFGVVALFSVPSHGLYFAMYDRLRDVSPALAGVAAEATGTALLTPSEVIKKRTQLGQAGYRAPLRGVLAAVASDLARSPVAVTRDLYSGVFLSCAVWMPFSAVYFDVYERMRRQRAPTWVSATTGGAVAAAVTSPLDVILTRLQTRHSGATTFRAAIASVRADRAWFHGVTARIAWLAPSAGISLTSYEFLAPRLDAALQAARQGQS